MPIQGDLSEGSHLIEQTLARGLDSCRMFISDYGMEPIER